MVEVLKAARMCPECGEDSYVYDTREQPDGSIVRKRRCRKCGLEFKTTEILSKIYLKNLKITRYRGRSKKTVGK